MEQSFSSHVSGARFFDCVEDAEFDIRIEFAVTVAGYAHRQMRVLSLDGVSVLHVCGLGNIAQIGDGVVQFVPVYVVNLPLRPSAVSDEPCKAMKPDLLFVEKGFPVSKLDGSNLNAGSPETLVNLPTKYAGKRIVFDQFEDALVTDFWDFHGFPNGVVKANSNILLN